MIILKTFTFHAAHQLWNDEWSEEKNLHVYGKCTGLHGHSYTLKVSVKGTPDETGMIMNFRDLKHIVHEHVVSRYDHVFINDLPEFENKQTTSENIAQAIFDRLYPLLKADTYSLHEVSLSETQSSEAIVDSTSC